MTKCKHSAISYQRSAISDQLSAISYQPLATLRKWPGYCSRSTSSSAIGAFRCDPWRI
ncbi:MAG: hypothetical protein F6K37_19325 [Moorea sp. SIO4E2]|uniref:hypothetical protein n=1 Tax=Moorena sp. SIO4E2 TaxID=2607826 RepID=UPI0013B9AB1D|nr:hypothetical protein [Moorena sp. SIO4E2]NEQ08019.1 hypothetical protein [Moorena sp. SIO4E2]